MSTQNSFIDKVQEIVNKYLTKLGFMVDEWHLGKVAIVNGDATLDVFIDGSTTTTPSVPCDPNYDFQIGDYVWVQFVNRNPNNKYVPSRRAIGEKRIVGGIGSHNHDEDYVSLNEVVDTPIASRILRLNENAKLPASITGDADSVDGVHGVNIVQISNEMSGTIGSSGWYTIATASTARAFGDFLIYDVYSGRHNFVRFQASTSFGHSVVNVLHGNKFSTETIHAVRILYNTADKVYGGAKLQINLVNPSYVIKYKMMLDQLGGWDSWVLQAPVLEDAPVGWTEDSSTKILNIADGLMHGKIDLATYSDKTYGMITTDDRDVKPNNTPVQSLMAYFTSKAGLNGAEDYDYQDLLVLNTWADTGGGKVNALAFDKDTMSIQHYQASQGATTWGTPKTLAYLNDIPNISADTMSRDANLITASGFYHCATNVPVINGETDKAVLHIQYGGASVWATQIAISWRHGSMWFRNKENGTWEAWKEVMSDYNASTPTFAKGTKRAVGEVRRYTDVASYYYNTGITGTIKIKFSSWTYTMMKLRIIGYNYNAIGGWELNLGGYDYALNSSWSTTSAKALTPCPFTTVRFCRDTDGSPCILLGTTTTVWTYPSVYIAEMLAQYNGKDTDFLSSVTISLITNETGITVQGSYTV